MITQLCLCLKAHFIICEVHVCSVCYCACFLFLFFFQSLAQLQVIAASQAERVLDTVIVRGEQKTHNTSEPVSARHRHGKIKPSDVRACKNDITYLAGAFVKLGNCLNVEIVKLKA